MNLHTLTPAKGSVKSKTRVGRGQGSGKGGTSTRGHKGAKSRSGYSKKVGFEGGQMPLQRRVPKFGFKNINRVEYQAVNLDALQALAEAGIEVITRDILIENGLVSKNDRIKVLGRGELKAKVTIEGHKFSATAQKAIEDLGGEVKNL